MSTLAAGGAFASGVPDDHKPKPTGEIVGGTPAVVIGLDADNRVIARRTYRSRGSGPTWTCHYFAVKEAPGGLDPAIDILRGAITPVPDEATALRCSSNSVEVY